ncbi:ATP-binding protein [Streptomyces sp. TS71-3]|nr:ATP-binding protein [Streptomyces sp. TS71-3]
MVAKESKHAANASTVGASPRSVHDPATGHFRSLTVYAESPDCAKAARDMIRSSLQSWKLPHAVDAAQLVVSELVGNVVHHAVPDNHLAEPGAGRRIDVTVMTWPEVLILAVSDEDSTPPDLPPGDFVSPNLAGGLLEAMLPDRGRGLLITQRLAESVWWSPGIKGGKSVWCRFDLDRLRAF